LEKLEDLVRAKNLMDRVELAGSIDDVAGHICNARIFALTSNTEGMPNTIIEAMAVGLPVVSTDCPCGGPAELIEDGVNGLLVPVGDAFALADAFRKILEDDALEQSLGENAAKITQKLSPDKVNKEWRDYLNSL
jgi:glycosyltransferase involved in cell wall biosynthesis